VRSLKLVSVALVSVLLVACTTPAQVTKPDAMTERKAALFEASADRAKVYLINGKIAGIAGDMFGLNHGYPSDFFIDSRLIGSMNKDDALVFDLRPGVYRFSWNVRSTDLIDKKTVANDAEVRVGGGDIVVLLGDYNQGGAAFGGLIGAMISPPKTNVRRGSISDVSKKTFVVPQSCDAQLCIK